MKCEAEYSVFGKPKSRTLSYCAGFALGDDGSVLLESADEVYYKLKGSDICGRVSVGNKESLKHLKLYLSSKGKFDYYEIQPYNGREMLWRVNGYSDMHRLRLNGELVCELKDFFMEGRFITDDILGIGIAEYRGAMNSFIWENYRLNVMIQSGELSLCDVQKTYVYKDAERYMSVCCGENVIEDKDGVCHGYLMECVPILREGKIEYMYVILHKHERTQEVRADLFKRLTPRESEIVELVSRGLTNKYIAGSLGISEGTVKKSLHNSYRKLNVCSRFDIVKLFGQNR